MPVAHPAQDTPVGLLIRYHRRRKGLRIADLAERLSITGSIVSRWERGGEFIPLARRIQIAGELDLDPGRLAEPEAIAVTPDERVALDALRRWPLSEREALRALILDLPRPEPTSC